MKAQGMSLGEIWRDVASLYFLATLAESELAGKELELESLHRGLGSVKRNLDGDDFKLLKGARKTLKSEQGRFPDFDTLLAGLAGAKILCLDRDKNDKEIVTVPRESANRLRDVVEHLAGLEDEEKKALSLITSCGVMFLRNLARSF